MSISEVSYVVADEPSEAGSTGEPGDAGVLITELDAGGSYDPHNETNDISFEEARRSLLANNGKLKLPHTISHIALRESFLSEAPFVVTTNRNFWRRMIDNIYFQDMLCYTYYFIVSCISDTAVVDLDKLAAAKETSYIKDVTTDIAQIYMTIPRKERDTFLPRCPEILAYLLINAMRTAVPKHNRLMGMCQFREILLDWCTELISGIRLTNCRRDREWLFTDAIEGPILTHPILSKTGDDEPPCVAKRKVLINRSPLIDMFCEPMKLPRQEKPRQFTISHIPSRPILSMLPSSSSPVLSDTSVRIRQDCITHREVRTLVGRTLRDRNKRLDLNRTTMQKFKKDSFISKKTLTSELLALEGEKKLASMRSTSALLKEKQHQQSAGELRNPIA